MNKNEPHIVISRDRSITIPDELKKLAAQYDHDIETITFDCPRYWDDHDLSGMAIYIRYECPDGTTGAYPADNISVDESDESLMHFTWTISQNVTHTPGSLAIQIAIEHVDDEGHVTLRWSSDRTSKGFIAKSISSDNVDLELTYPDTISSLVQSVNELNRKAGIPSVVSTATEMTALLEEGEPGAVYRYTGTTGTYENGELYIIEEE